MKKIFSQSIKISINILLIIFLLGCGNNIEQDITSPVFSNIPEDVIIDIDTYYDLLDLGLTASDEIDGDLTESISVNINDTKRLIEGIYVVTYSVADSAGNTVEQEIILIVIPTQYNVPDDFNIVILNSSEVAIESYKPTATKEVMIPSTIDGRIVVVISDYAFQDSQLISVFIPEGVTTIGEGAFYNNLLTSITIPNSVTSIGESAFSRNQLMSVTIPDNVTSIGINAFSGNLLTNVTISNSVATIGEGAFLFNLLTSVTIPANVTTIGDNAFTANQLTSVIILGDETRFNDLWNDIGFPEALKPIE